MEPTTTYPAVDLARTPVSPPTKPTSHPTALSPSSPTPR